MSPDNIRMQILDELITNSNDSLFEMDKIHAYVSEREFIEPILPFYYDTQTRISTYYIMDETLGAFIQAYQMAYRSPLIDYFRCTHAVFVESGIWNLWHLQFMPSKGQFYDSTSNDMILFGDLFPAWAAFVIGCSFSGIVFVYEVISLKCFHHQIRNGIKRTFQ